MAGKRAYKILIVDHILVCYICRFGNRGSQSELIPGSFRVYAMLHSLNFYPLGQIPISS